MPNHIDPAHDARQSPRATLSAYIRNDGGPDSEPQGYAELSDGLLWSALKARMLSRMPGAFRFCEVGDRYWSSRILDEYPASSGVAVVRGDAAASERRTERDADGPEPRRETVVANPADLAALPEGSFDVTLSLDDALAMADRPEILLNELVRITNPHGFVALLVPNLYHAMSWNLARAQLDEAERALTGRTSIAPEWGELNVFTPGSIEEMVRRVGARPHLVLGLPIVSGALSGAGVVDAATHRELLASERAREKIQTIEESLLSECGLAARGTKLLAIARVRPMARQWGDFWL